MLVTKEKLESARTPNGGYSKAQIAFGQKLTGESRWYKRLVGKHVADADWLSFVSKGQKGKLKAKQKQKILNAMAKGDDWAWKPEKKDIPKIKIKSKKNKNRGRKKERREKLSKFDDENFYLSKEWRMLRVRVLEKYECKCMMCGQSPRDHGIVIHVDHIKPRSKYPELSLDFNNLQLLCESCNIGKSNKYETDWRPDVKNAEEELDIKLLLSSPLH